MNVDQIVNAWGGQWTPAQRNAHERVFVWPADRSNPMELNMSVEAGPHVPYASLYVYLRGRLVCRTTSDAADTVESFVRRGKMDVQYLERQIKTLLPD